MTTVNTTTTPKMGNPAGNHAHTSTTDESALIAQYGAIENALSTALWHVRRAHDAASMQVATGKAVRAATLLKRACEAFRETTREGVAV